MKIKLSLVLFLLLSKIVFSQNTLTIFNDLLPNASKSTVYNDEIYFSLPSQGKIVKTSLLSPNSPIVDVVTGLTMPVGMSVYGNELYFVEFASSIMNLQPNTGDLCKINLLDSNPSVTVLVSGLNFPLNISVSPTAIILNENILQSNVSLTQSLTEKIDPFTFAKTLIFSEPLVSDYEFYNGNLLILTTDYNGNPAIRSHNLTTNTTTNVFSTTQQNLAPYSGVVLGNDLFYVNAVVPGSLYKLSLSAPNPSPVSIVNNFMDGASTVTFEDIRNDSSGNLILYGHAYNSSTSTSQFKLYKLSKNFLNVDDSVKHNSIVFYPNPTKDYINFSEELFNIEIFSFNGQKVLHFLSAKSIEISTLSKGVYFMKAIDKRGNVVKEKIVKI